MDIVFLLLLERMLSRQVRQKFRAHQSPDEVGFETKAFSAN